ncbi:MAG: ROK family protein [Clostridiales bacterium]|nr:ROK family protein [Clostridiales bacterium]
MVTKIPIDKIAVPADIKLVNRQKILETFLDGEKQTTAAIHEMTGISKPTIMRALQYFCEKGMLKSAGFGGVTSSGGRKSEYFVFADNRRILSIALWPDAVTLALSGLVGNEVYAIAHYDHILDNSLEAAFLYLQKCVQTYLAEQNVTISDLYGVALSVAGTVDYGTGVLRYNSHAPGWGVNIPLVEHLKSIFGDKCVFFVDNSGKATGRAILLDYPQFAECRLLTVFTTWGVSSCMIERGHILNGRDSLIGEIGHMQISDVHTGQCGCGKHSCLESAIRLEHVREILEKENAPWLNDEPLSFKALFDHSRQGDEAARKVVRYLAHCFAAALHNLSLAYNQEIVVFQGDFAWADDYFDRCLKEELDEFRYYPSGDCFTTVYDKRELPALAARGGASQLRKRFFSSMAFD